MEDQKEAGGNQKEGQGKRKMKKFFFALVIIALLIVWIGIFLPQDPGSKQEISFLVKRGEGTRDIAIHLEQEGLVPSSPLFYLFVLSTGISGKLQAGTYGFSSAMSPFEISKKLAMGDVIEEHITIIEGWGIKDIAAYFTEKGLFQEKEVLAYTDFEGYLFPDTYLVTKDIKLKEIIQLMLQTFEEKISSEWRAEIQKQGKTLSDIVIMASLLEKELQTLEDKKIAADVLWKRLDIGMALQVDASPITYKQRGLPEKPIANPGLKSIEAAIYPTESPYWYYLSTPEGETIFSRTLEEHNTAKAQYLK
ncbi:endolytic transglycosylase MltG [Patescibacteria group bacterium]|nr:endolytic transglycosylase MltG [Patescibacteria group bacterium]